MAVIAMTREMGSLGRDVALALAEDLGLELIQHQLVEHVADKMRLGEALVNRFLEGKAGLLERWGVNEQHLSLYTTEEILEVAARRNVLIRGWGAAYVLRKVPHVLCLRVCAPDVLRAEVLMRRIGIDDRNLALKEIRANDAAHTRTMMHMFHVEDWGNPTLFDATFNTAKMSVESCVQAARELAMRPEFAETPASREMLEDMMIRARVDAALKTNAATNRSNPSFEIDLVPGAGTVVLSGMVYDADFARQAEQVVAGVEGVRRVDNRLRVMSQAVIGP